MLCPFANQKPVQSHGGHMTQNLGLILHVQAGNGSPFGWFSDPRNKASSNFWVGKNGELEQYVDSDNQAWAQAAGNATYQSVETEGYPNEPLNPKQIATLGRLYAWERSVYGFPFALVERPGQVGFGWHGLGGAAWGGHTGCPGDLRKAQRPVVLQKAQQILSPPPTPVEPVSFGQVQNMGDNMQRQDVHVPSLDDNGNGWIDTGIPFEKFVTCLVHGPAPDRDTYGWANIYWSANNTNNQARIEFECGAPRQSLDVTLWSVQ